MITLLPYWLAHSYAEFTGERLRSGERLTAAGLARMMARDVTILFGAAIPLIPLLVWWATGGHLTGAVTAVVWTSAATIVITELMVGLRAELSGRRLLAQAAIGAFLGLMVIAPKIVLH